MEPIGIKTHNGVILEPSKNGFDAGAATFGCAYIDKEEPTITYLYYSGASDNIWSHTGIGLAISRNGKDFRKMENLNPLIDGKRVEFNSKESVTPAIVRINNYYYMFFAGKSTTRSRFFPTGRKIGVAFADDPCGPWEPLGVIAKPIRYWEGWSIDLGPSVIKINENEVIIFYSNVNNKIPLNNFIGSKYLRRSIGLLKIMIRSPRSIKARKYKGNPLYHLNGVKGSFCESLFCPGYFSLKDKHFLLPSMSTYSIGFPYQQYIGLVTDTTPYFKLHNKVHLLIDGPKEKKNIIPNIKSEIALDTPTPLVKDDEIFIYYSVMDRFDNVWKIALSCYNRNLFEK